MKNLILVLTITTVHLSSCIKTTLTQGGRKGVLTASQTPTAGVEATPDSVTPTATATPTVTATPTSTSSTLQIDKSSYDFGVALVGQTYSATFTLTNSGTTEVSSLAGSGLSGELSFLGGSFPGTNGTCSTSLSAGSSCTIVLSLIPTSSGSLSQTLSVSSSST